jgi:hypothetical protein
MAKDSEPLTDQDFQTIKSNLADLDKAEEQIRKAIRAGIDVGDAPATAKVQRDKLLALKNTYFPGKM